MFICSEEVCKADGKSKVEEAEKEELVKYNLYQNGTPIYFNPNTGMLCTEDQTINSSESKSGCMKWYIFNDSETNEYVNMILDHNTTTTIAWNPKENNNSDMSTITDALNNDVSKWDNNVKSTARL